MDDKKRKILIITRYFLPFFPSLGGVMRIFTLANFLNRNGNEVYILTGTGKYYGYFGYKDSLSNVKIKYIGYSGSDCSIENIQSKTQKRLSLLGSFVSKKIDGLLYVFNRLCIPDESVLLLNVFVREATTIINEFGIKNVIISTPPHGMQLIGVRLKRHLGNSINLIVDYRDSWNTSKIFRHKTYIGTSINKIIEKNVLQSCDYFTYVSEPILHKIENFYRIDLNKKSILVMNGFSKTYIENEPELNLDNQKIKIGYFGALNSKRKSYRNISNLIEVLAENLYLAEKYEFHFFGSINIHHPRLMEMNLFHVFPNIDHDRAIGEMKKMDYLMIVHSDPESSEEVVTGKFFEYISVKKPIICLAPMNMEAGRLVNKYNIGFHIDICNKDCIKVGLTGLKKPKAEQYYANLDINLFSREAQYIKILNILK